MAAKPFIEKASSYVFPTALKQKSGLGRLTVGLFEITTTPIRAGFDVVARSSGWASMQVAKATGNGAWAVLQAPFKGAYKISKSALGAVTHHPIAAGTLAVGAGIIAWGHAQHDKAAAQTQQDAMNSMVGAYTNSVTPQEYAALAARQNQGQGHAASVTAGREAAANQPAPPTA